MPKLTRIQCSPTFRVCEQLPPAGGAVIETAERNRRRMLSNVEPQSKKIVTRQG
jgi:hypothetical protein